MGTEMFLNFRPETQGHGEIEKEILGDVKAGTNGLTLRWWAVTENVDSRLLCQKPLSEREPGV